MKFNERIIEYVLDHQLMLIIVTYVFFLAGALWNTLGLFESVMSFTTPFVLIITAIVSWVLTYSLTAKSGIAFGIIFVGTWAIEALGVATGFPFGSYLYTDVLGWKVLGVSLVIPFAWVSVISSSDAVAGHFFGKTSIVLVALFATLFDFFLEFAAEALDYWHWGSMPPPLSNYLSWFVISLTAAALLRDTARRRPFLRLPAHLYIAQLLYFALTVIGTHYDTLVK